MTLDLRARLAMLVAVTVMVIAFTHPLWVLGVLAGLVLVLLWTRTPLHGLGRLLRPLLPILLLVALFAAFATPDRVLHDPAHQRVLWRWGPLRATFGGVLLGCTLLLRMLSMVLVTWAVLAEASLDEVLELAAHWKLPASVAIMLSAAVAAIPNLSQRREQIMQAQQARGARVEVRNPFKRWAATVAIMVPLITSSLLTAENLAVALSARGYGAHRTMTTMRDLEWRARDAVIACGCLVIALVAVVARVALGTGRL